VLPGDHVDVALTRLLDKENGSTQVVLQDVRVLAIDQAADERAANATIAKSVTLEVDTVGAQKLGLASSIGTLSLLLRKAGETASEKSLRVTIKDLFQEMIPDRGRGKSVTITVNRGSAKAMVKEGYSVPVEDDGRAVATVGAN
jgi:pilus assembly protein CpaB